MLTSLMLALCVSVPSEAPTEERWPVALQTRVNSIAKTFEGELAVWVKDLQTGERYTLNAATPMYLASTIKIFVLHDLFALAAAEEIDLDESVTITTDDYRDGSALSRAKAADRVMTLRELAVQMMSASDNLATDMLLKRIGVEDFNTRLAKRVEGVGEITPMVDVRRLVYSNLAPAALDLTAPQVLEVRSVSSHTQRARLLSKMLGIPRLRSSRLRRSWRAYYASGVNSAPMEVMGGVLESLALGKAVSEQDSEAMVTIMRGCTTGTRRLRRHFPAELPFAHKTGTQYRRACDMGIVELKHTVVVAICAKEFGSLSRAERAMSRVGEAVFKVLGGES